MNRRNLFSMALAGLGGWIASWIPEASARSKSDAVKSLGLHIEVPICDYVQYSFPDEPYMSRMEIKKALTKKTSSSANPVIVRWYYETEVPPSLVPIPLTAPKGWMIRRW